jgi:hypothetical protein
MRAIIVELMGSEDSLLAVYYFLQKDTPRLDKLLIIQDIE